MIFFNRGDHFEAAPLPREAQFAPVFAVCVGDMDGDGHEDIFLAQNFFAFRVEDDRLDSSRGLLLRGDGKGGFTAVPGQVSGITVYGEQRGAAACDSQPRSAAVSGQRQRKVKPALFERMKFGAVTRICSQPR